MMELDISRARRETGTSIERLAEYASVRVRDLSEWERTGSVPRKFAHRVRWALWAARRDVSLARAGIPECEGLDELMTAPGPPDSKELTRHLKSCDVCSARTKHIDEHVEPAPAMDGSLLMRVLPLVERLDGLQQSAAYGALAILAMGGVGVLILLVMGIARLDPTMVLGSLGLLLLLMLSGAAGGVVHYATRSMRDIGSLGHYASSILTVYGYTAAVFGLVALAALFVGWEAIGPELHEMFTTGTGWAVSGIVGGFFGLVFGYHTRD